MTGGVSTRRLGGLRIVYQMMGLIGVELTRACGLGHLNNRSVRYIVLRHLRYSRF